MLVCRDILITAARGAIVGKAQSLPILEMHVEQSLIGAVKADTPLSKSQKRIVIAEIRSEYQKTTVETIRPANIRYCSKIGVIIEKLIRCADCHHVGIDIHDLPELSLPPQLDFREGRY